MGERATDAFPVMNPRQSLSKLWSAKYGYHLAQRYGRFRRSREAKRLRRSSFAQQPETGRPVGRQASATFPWRLATLAGRSSLPEACRLLATFTRCAGQPRSLLLGSDGTLDRRSAETAMRSAGVTCPVDFRTVDGSPLGLEMTPSTAAHPMVKKLVFIADVVSADGQPTLYADTDVVFFPAAAELDGMLAGRSGPAYMLDMVPTFDNRLLHDTTEADSPVNGGFLWLPRPLDWRRARGRLAALGPDFTPTHFTEQAAVHLAMHDSGGTPFDHNRFILSVADQFEWRDRFARSPGVVCRHYVSSIRHKMWIL